MSRPITIADALYWKYGGVFSTIEDKITVWRHPTEKQPDEVECLAILEEYKKHLASILYQEKRSKEYDSVGDQLDRVTKALKYLKANGVDIGPDGSAQVERVDAVKQKYPKP